MSVLSNNTSVTDTHVTGLLITHCIYCIRCIVAASLQ